MLLSNCKLTICQVIFKRGFINITKISRHLLGRQFIFKYSKCYDLGVRTVNFVTKSSINFLTNYKCSTFKKYHLKMVRV